MKRILLKISGEALAGNNNPIDASKALELAKKIRDIREAGYQIHIVLGGGNIYRGSDLIKAGVKADDSHNMSMLSTVFNAVTLKNFLEQVGLKAEVLDILGIRFLSPYTSQKAIESLSAGSIVISCSGTGVPYFSTDTAGVLRAVETKCDAMIKLTKVDGVYDSDPVKNPHAERFDFLSYDEFLAKDLRVLDQTAIVLARDNSLQIFVSKIENLGLATLLFSEKVGTMIQKAQ